MNEQLTQRKLNGEREGIQTWNTTRLIQFSQRNLTAPKLCSYGHQVLSACDIKATDALIA